MTVVDTKALDLLGKEVSFRYDRKVTLSAQTFITYSEVFSGTVTQVLIDLNSPVKFALETGDYYEFSELLDFSLKN